MNVELANQIDEKFLNDVLSDEKYEWIRSYDIHIKMFYKYGKYDKEGNLKTPALQKNGKAIPLAIRIVSSFNRLTDDVDVKILINKDLWDEYSEIERKASLDGILHYLELKTDKIGEPIPISDDNDKVQLKLKHPDFYCEGFNCMAEKYGNAYIPIQEARYISNLINNNEISKNDTKKKIEPDDVLKKKEKYINKKDKHDIKENTIIENEDDEVNLDDIQI